VSDDSPVSLSRGLPETVLPRPPEQWLRALAEAVGQSPALRRDAVAEVVGAHPQFLAGWATLAEMATDDLESYAYARVGYHRGLDALRAAGWRGSGYVRWEHEENQGFLRSLEALRAAAEAIGESDEAERCSLFLRQLDPSGGA
jgi:hypothetical protein